MMILGLFYATNLSQIQCHMDMDALSSGVSNYRIDIFEFSPWGSDFSISVTTNRRIASHRNSHPKLSDAKNPVFMIAAWRAFD